MMGLMVLQQMHDCTDREAVEQFCFNIQWHYALNITSFSDAAGYITGTSCALCGQTITRAEWRTELLRAAFDALPPFPGGR